MYCSSTELRQNIHAFALFYSFSDIVFMPLTSLGKPVFFIEKSLICESSPRKRSPLIPRDRFSGDFTPGSFDLKGLSLSRSLLCARPGEKVISLSDWFGIQREQQRHSEAVKNRYQSRYLVIIDMKNDVKPVVVFARRKLLIDSHLFLDNCPWLRALVQ